LGTRAGEFITKDLELAANVDEITQHVADDIQTAFNNGRKKALVYGVSVKHAAFLRNEIQMRGISCEVIDGSMDRAVRRAIIDRFKRGELKCISSCDVLTTGFNVPDVDLIALVRPTQSTSLYVQILGRGMRIAPIKQNCCVLDYGGNIARHGPIDNLKIKERQKGASKGNTPVKDCPNCFAEVKVQARECEHCGHSFPPPQRKANQSASSLPVLSGGKKEDTKQRIEISRTSARKHYKGRDTSNTPTCCVEYYQAGGSLRAASDYLCFEHEGGSFPWKKAQQWWAANVGTVPPLTVDEAVHRLNTEEFPRVIEIVVKQNGEYLNVVEVLQDENSVREPGIDDIEPVPADLNLPDSFGDDDILF
jgi:DNA repair protein RadD